MLLLVLFQFFLVNGELVEWPDYDCTENEYYNPISLSKLLGNELKTYYNVIVSFVCIK